MITRVKIRGYKSLKSVDVQLQPLTVFIGPNATGKSNLFDALSLLSRCVTAKTITEAFKDHRGTPVETFFYGAGGLDWLLKQPTVQFTIEVDIELSPGVVEITNQRIREMRSKQAQSVRETHLRYTLTVGMTMESGHLGVREEQLAAFNPGDIETVSAKPFIQHLGNKLGLRVEDQEKVYEYPVGKDYTLVSTAYPPSHPYLVAFREELSRWRFYYPDPKTIREESLLKEAEVLGPLGADVAAFYNTLRTRNLRQFDALKRTLPLLLPEVQDLAIERTTEGLLRLAVMEHGVAYSARVISEGTLRVLALLAITNPLTLTTVIGYEEPENGVHPRRLQLIAELLKNTASAGRQVLVNTHSPQLPEYFEPNAVVLCGKNNGATTFTPLKNLGPEFQAGQIEQAVEETPLTERVLRGDFGG